MKISVIIPTYKPQEYLWECLDSVCSQDCSKEDFEIILILNGCCEPYNSQILEYISTKPSFSWKYIQTGTSGVSNARNLGLDVAKGRFIAFIDDDDFISPCYLSELYNLTDDTTMALSYELAFTDGQMNYHPYYISKEFNKLCDNAIIPFYKARKLFNGPVYKLISRDIIGDRRFDISIKNGEDALFMFLISDKFKYVRFTSRNAIYYRRFRKGSAIYKRGSKFRQICNSTRLIVKYLHIFFTRPQSYNIAFLTTRIAGTIKILL